MSNLEKVSAYYIAAITSEIISKQSELDQTYITKSDSLTQLDGVLPVEAPMPILERAFEALRQSGVIKEIDDELAGAFYRLMPSAASNIVSDSHKDPNSLIYKYRAIGPQFLASAASTLNLDKQDRYPVPLEEPARVPASDRIVTINHNQQDEIEGRTLEIIQELEPENSIDGEDGLRELILGKLKAGRELVLAGVFSLDSLRLTLVVGLQMLVEKYKDHAIGAVAGNLLALILKELGL